MNSLTDPGVAELLERLHREADAQTLSSSITLKGGTEYSVLVDTTNGRVPES